ncbi:MAG: 16S rRNA (uracil(1498)-N(3))-methyltransferase [Porticoccaceae bacterium]|nr:16S rRNA (uracil(1498)-N(3))-methyltransferase [Porticoccaceae bacterium]
MRIPRLYVNRQLGIGVATNLDDQEARYMRSVLRLKEGDPVVVFNGLGGEYQALLQTSGKNSASVVPSEFDVINRESPLKVHLGIGISRGERMDIVMQKATELGVTEITPLFTQRCEVKLNAGRAVKKTQHWQQIVVSACQQSQRNRVPTVHRAVDLSDWLATTGGELKLVLDHRGGLGVKDLAPSAVGVVLLVGPEGGFDSAEISAVTDADFVSLSLGPRVLRTETAPIAALSILQARWGDLL